VTLQPLFPETIPAVLQDASDHLVLAARSPATLRAYRTDWGAFVAWCHAQDVTALPAQPETVSAWIASRLEQGRKAATLARGVAAVSCAHELAGFESFSYSRLVQDALRGMRRTLGTVPTRKAPATVDLLRRMLDVQPDTLIGRRNRALLALGFAGALRRSELVVLEVTDLVAQDGGALLTLRRSKTDPYGAGQTIGILNGSTIRALDHLTTWCEAAGITSGRLFRSVDRHGRIGGADHQDSRRGHGARSGALLGAFAKGGVYHFRSRGRCRCAADRRNLAASEPRCAAELCPARLATEGPCRTPLPVIPSQTATTSDGDRTPRTSGSVQGVRSG